MSISGTYVNNNTGETLSITGNDSNGQLTGTLTSQGRTLTVSGNYHFASSKGPLTSIAFYAIAPDPNIYEAWVGNGTAQGFAQINAMGARTTIDANGTTAVTVGLGGLFVRK